MEQIGWLMVLVAAVGALRDIEFKNCKHKNGSSSCKVKAVQINGCLKPSTWADEERHIYMYKKGDPKAPCRIDKGSTLNLNISFEPGFSGDSLRSQFTLPDLSACWKKGDPLCPVSSTPELGCQFTKCPLERGRLQRYEITLRVTQQSTPVTNNRVIYQMRWKLWNNKEKKNTCCFNIPVQY